MLIILDNVAQISSVVPPSSISYQELKSLYTDPEGDAIKIETSISPSASWLSYNSATDLLEGNPTDNNDVGQIQITISAFNEFGIEKIYAADLVMNLDVV